MKILTSMNKVKGLCHIFVIIRYTTPSPSKFRQVFFTLLSWPKNAKIGILACFERK